MINEQGISSGLVMKKRLSSVPYLLVIPAVAVGLLAGKVYHVVAGSEISLASVLVHCICGSIDLLLAVFHFWVGAFVAVCKVATLIATMYPF